MKRYANYHKHTHYSNIMTLDSIAKPEDYMKRAVELGQEEYFTTEHGYQGNLFETYTLCQNYNLKCIFAVEAYYVDNRFEKDKGNYHIMLIARNENGRLNINRILSEANLTGYYYKPRIDRELLLPLKPDDVFVTTACVASRMFKGDDWLNAFFLPVYNHFGDSLYLEVQNHNEDIQKEHNRRILDVADTYDLKIVHANDSHYIYPEDSQYRKQFLKAKGINYGEEDSFILDYPDYVTIVERYRTQGVLSDEQIYSALDNTLDFLQCDGVEINKDFKIPSVSKDSNKELKQILNKEWQKERINIPKEHHTHYINEIRYETGMVERCGMADYFVLNYKVVKDAKEKYGGVLTHTGRGSGVSFYINKLLGLTEVDRIWCPVKLYPTRFLSDVRILQSRSLPDIDQNWANVEPIIQATKDLLGDDGTRQMVSFKPMQNSSAFRLWCKSLGMKIDEYDTVAKDLGDYKGEYQGEYKDDPKWGKLIDDSKRFKGVIESIAPSPCSYLLYDKPITEHIGVIRVGDVPCCLLDGYNCDYYKFLKQDYLIVTVWDIISKVYKAIGQPIDTIKELISKCDDKVWDLYANGMTSTLNQADTDYDKQILIKYKPHSFSELSAYAAALRPGFASQLNNFIERKPYTTGESELDNLLEDSFHYLMYQESIMTYLVWLNIPEKDTYDIIKKISKKKFKQEELEELKSKLRKNWIEKIGNDNNFDKTWQAVEDASRYSFNASHSVSVALDSMYGAYLKSHYPLEYFTVVFDIYKDDLIKTSALTNELEYFGLKLLPIRFRYSSDSYMADKETNSIYKGLSSLKYMNATAAQKLYEMRDMNFPTFIDFLKVNPCDSRATKALIKLNFFSEFGKSQYLLDIYDIYDKYGNASQIRIDKCPLSETVMQKYAKSTAKLYKLFDKEGFVKELCGQVENKSIPIGELIETQAEYLGYIDYVNPKAVDYGYILDIDTKYSPKLSVYCLDTGKTITLKMSKKDYQQSDLQANMLIKYKVVKRNKSRKDGNKWVKIPDEFDLWIENFKKI